MAKILKVRKTQEEEVVAILKKHGFQEIPESEIEKEPYKSIYRLPGCFENESDVKRSRVREGKKK